MDVVLGFPLCIRYFLSIYVFDQFLICDLDKPASACPHFIEKLFLWHQILGLYGLYVLSMFIH